jgi:ATP/maltotriose-dependent transcriptional regulator MalT
MNRNSNQDGTQLNGYEPLTSQRFPVLLVLVPPSQYVPSLANQAMSYSFASIVQDNGRLLLELNNNDLMSLFQQQRHGEGFPILPAAPIDADRPALEPLSRREHEVLHLIAHGMSNQEIADRLVLAQSTVKMHIKRIYRKLQVKNRVQAVELARKHALVPRF